MLDEFEATMDKQHTEAAIDLAATQKAQRAAETGKSSPCKTQAQDEATEEAEGSGEQVVDSVETNDGKEGAAQGDEVAVDEIVVELQEDATEQVEENQPPQDKVAEEEEEQQAEEEEEAPDYRSVTPLKTARPLLLPPFSAVTEPTRCLLVPLSRYLASRRR